MIGTDVEFFLWDTKRDRFVPAHRFLPPAGERIFLTTPHGSQNGESSAFRDGFAVELNVPPQFCRAYLWNCLHHALVDLRYKAKIPPEIIFSSRPLVQLNMSEQESWPSDVTELGCSPTLNAYTGQITEIKEKPPWRTSGAHIHISQMSEGWMASPSNHLLFIKMCDLIVGVPETILFGDDDAFQRRTLYGRAGEFRVQHYKGLDEYSRPYDRKGLEYRVCSSRMFNHIATYALLFGLVRDFVWKNFDVLKANWNPAIEPKVQKAINTGVGVEELMEEILRLEKKVKEAMGVSPLSCGWDVVQTRDSWSGYPINKWRHWTPDLLFDLRERILKGKGFTENSLETWKAEGHTSWNEFASGWKLGAPDPTLPKTEVRTGLLPKRDARGRFAKRAA